MSKIQFGKIAKWQEMELANIFSDTAERSRGYS